MGMQMDFQGLLMPDSNSIGIPDRHVKGEGM